MLVMPASAPFDAVPVAGPSWNTPLKMVPLGVSWSASTTTAPVKRTSAAAIAILLVTLLLLQSIVLPLFRTLELTFPVARRCDGVLWLCAESHAIQRVQGRPQTAAQSSQIGRASCRERV